MANTILTPVTLWRDFDDKLPFNEEVSPEENDGTAVSRDVFFYGRETEKGRVKIYARYSFPAQQESFPAVLLLFEAGFGFDDRLVKEFVERGYGVLCVDYCGENGTEKHTVYPEDVDYANYCRAQDRLDRADPSARQTSWYEWAGVARYAARYLSERPEVTAVGAVGLRSGGEVLFKIAPYAPLACFVSVCAAGWLAYRGMEKFSGTEQHVFDEERHRFIAGIDSQSYAPYVKCPVMLISAINDQKYNYDRVYDTFRQLNPEVEKAILYSAHGNGLIGSHSKHNIFLFLDKYLKGRSVYLSKPIGLEVGEDERGDLVATCSFDEEGEIVEYGVFYTEKITGSTARDWTRILGKSENLNGTKGIIPLDVYPSGDKMLVYAFAKYSNNFSVTSKILDVVLDKNYRNSRPATRVIYSNRDELNGFSAYRRRARSVADCFMDGASSALRLLPGYGGIEGLDVSEGLISYRVSEPGYEPPEGASFLFDAYSADGATLKIIFYLDAEEKAGYSFETRVDAGGKWKSILLSSADLKSETGAPLPDYSGVVSVVFLCEDGDALVNNLLWI